MVRFNELRITDDEKNLIIDAQIDNIDYFDGCYLSDIQIDTQDKYLDPENYKGKVFSLQLGQNTQSYVKLIEKDSNSNVRHVRLFLDGSETEWINHVPDFKNNMYIVTVTASGTPKSTTPCELQDNVVYGATFSLCRPYARFLNSMKELDKNCEIPKNFIDSFLRFKSVTIAMAVGDFSLAARNFKKYILSLKQDSTTSNCGCYG